MRKTRSHGVFPHREDQNIRNSSISTTSVLRSVNLEEDATRRGEMMLILRHWVNPDMTLLV